MWNVSLEIQLRPEVKRGTPSTNIHELRYIMALRGVILYPSTNFENEGRN
jgi:hypothetical protein